MKKEYTIEKDRILKHSQDFAFLRAEGQKYIETFSNKLWTDYNSHDPGITILEVLAYAVSELGYRTNFDIEDLLSNENGEINNGTFFSARNILTNAALTNLDFRKLLIDIEGVNNAWIINHEETKDNLGYFESLANEIPIYLNVREDKLSLNARDSRDRELKQLPIRGLNQVIVELSDSLEFGELNTVGTLYSWSIDDQFIEVEIIPESEFDTWTSEKASLLENINELSKIVDKTVNIVDKQIEVSVKRKSDVTQTLKLIIKPYDILELDAIKTHFEKPDPIIEVIKILLGKKLAYDVTLSKIQLNLNENRNLTEDWLCVETVSEIEIAICADIELATAADAEEIMAKIQQAIDFIFNAPIRFYTLNQMLDKGFNAKEIFSGPKLEHGFLLDEEVEKTQLPTCLHASDIIAALMDIEGVKAVNNLLLTAYDKNGIPIEGSKNQSWCIHLNGKVNPVFSLQKSKLLLLRDGIPFLIPDKNGLEIQEGIYYLKAQNNIFKLEGQDKDFQKEKGSHYQLDEYYTIQDDFPTTYGIGKGELSDKETELRKAQAKQLKAYLQHFDQLLADFFNQLHRAKDLFDINPIEETYFPQYLDEISGVEAENFSDEVYAKAFKETLSPTDKKAKRSLYEDEKLFYNRRNRILDHLLARFGESFSDYAFMMFTMQQNAQGLAELAIQEEELIKDKQDFLAQYPERSYSRGLGINYCQEKSFLTEHEWKIGERGGYENRIAGLLGINNNHLRDIVDPVPKVNWQYVTDVGTLNFKLFSNNFFTLQERWEMAHQLINNAGAYRVSNTVNHRIHFIDDSGIKIAQLVQNFTSQQEAKEYIPKLYQAINTRLENFYCLEHILLRPLFSATDLLTVCLQDECNLEVNHDPYSFKATVVLPGWLARFSNRHFRKYAEQIIEQEAPAHVLMKICWVGRDDMLGFQNVYNEWIIAYRDLKENYCKKPLTEATEIAYTNALNALIQQLKELNSIYDEGTLNDCIESELDNPVILNNSSLGSIKNIQS